MEKKHASETGIRVTIPQGTDEAAGVDEVVSDFIKGDTEAVLKDLHEPHSDEPYKAPEHKSKRHKHKKEEK